MAGKKRYLIAFLLLALLLAGCKGGDSSKESRAYTIYYTNLAGTRLEEKRYVPTADRFDGILTELLEQFASPSYSDVVSAMPLGVSINSYTMGVDDLQVDFNAAYLGLSNVQEILLRAGIVKTLVQLPGVTRVRLSVDGQPLKDSDGREVLAMNEDSFIDSREEGINSYHYVTLDLYFSNATGDKVGKEMRNVFYSSNLIIEKVIVEQIIKGPANEKLLAVADPSVLIRSVKISKNICVIDLDSKFNNAPENGAVKPETALYAFVNAICDACDVGGVQFKIDGESDVRFRGEVNLDRVFKRDADMIEASGAMEPLAEIFLDEKGAEDQTVTAANDSAEAVTEEQSEQESTAVPKAQPVNGQPAGGQAASSEAQTQETPASPEQEGNSAAAKQGKGVGVDPALVEDSE